MTTKARALRTSMPRTTRLITTVCPNGRLRIRMTLGRVDPEKVMLILLLNYRSENHLQLAGVNKHTRVQSIMGSYSAVPMCDPEATSHYH